LLAGADGFRQWRLFRVGHGQGCRRFEFSLKPGPQAFDLLDQVRAG
jgi:hypothetical protein